MAQKPIRELQAKELIRDQFGDMSEKPDIQCIDPLLLLPPHGRMRVQRSVWQKLMSVLVNAANADM
jgi:hypothetical protein